ncbi:allophanate hydrolase, partial [Mycobacterium tuberculosis]|nr:allophanate hydrolase [Mycobacterium tuberculosis]
DAQTTGGYPKIGSVILADQWRLAQIPLGTRVRFERVTVADDGEAREDGARYLQQIDTAVDWPREGILWSAHRIAAARR